jgi:hypothetical protein
MTKAKRQSPKTEIPAPPNHRRPWTDAQLDALARAYKAGERNINALAANHGRTAVAVNFKLVRLHLKEPQTTSMWDEATVTRLTSLWEAGHTTGHIAKEIGRSRSAVSGKLDRLGYFRGGQVVRPSDAPQTTIIHQPSIRRFSWE